MANATVTFTIRELSYGVNPESPPVERRLRLGYSVYANVSAQGTPPILSEDDLILEISLGSAETDPYRFPRLIATDDASPKGVSNGKVHTAALRAKSLDPLFQGWHVEAEVPLLFEKAKTTYVSTKLIYQGKAVASTKARVWNALQLNPTQPITKKLAQGSQRFPCLASQLCISHRSVVSKNLSSYDYTGTSNDLNRLADITDELSARLAQGLGSVWREAEAKADQSTLYNGFSLTEREARAFGNKQGQDLELFGSVGEQQIAVANEVWARAITELVCFTPYRSTGTVYNDGEHGTTVTVGGVKVQSTLEYDLAEGVSGAVNEPHFPIAHACQQLVTLAVLSRGWSIVSPASEAIPARQIALPAGSRSAIFYTKFLKPDPGTWVPHGKTLGEVPNYADLGEGLIKWLNPGMEKQTPDASTLVSLGDTNGKTAFGPGSIAVFANGLPQDHGLEVHNLDNPKRTVARRPAEVAEHDAYLAWKAEHPKETSIPKGLRKEKPSEVWMYGANLNDNSGAAHIGCILRVDKTARRYQVLDTGALNTGADYGIWPGIPGIRDYPETRGNMHSLKDPSRGIGLAPILTASKADVLYRHVRKVLKIARPLGFMRLVVARRDITMSFDNVNQWLLYASPLLRMYGSSPAEGNRATYADLLWSLRDFPRRDQLRVIWSVRAPYLQLADTMLTEPRSLGVYALVTKTMERLRADAHKPTKDAEKHRNDLKNLRECVNAEDISASGSPHTAAAVPQNGADAAANDLPLGEPPDTANDGDKRAWLIAHGLGRNMLAATRLLSRYTRFCLDFEVNADGTVAAATLNSPRPLWHEAEDAFAPSDAKSKVARLQMPLICESAGGWPATAAGFKAWAKQSQQLRASVGSGLISQFF
jgi:hypothetical protein